MVLGEARARNPDDPENVAAPSEPAMTGIVPRQRVGFVRSLTMIVEDFSTRCRELAGVRQARQYRPDPVSDGSTSELAGASALLLLWYRVLRQGDTEKENRHIKR